MSFRVNTNVTAQVAHRHLLKLTEAHADSTQKQSSGSRIYQAANDPAGLAISQKLSAQTRSHAQAIRNANDGVSALQVAEGALNEISAIAIRLKELAMQSATDTVGPLERAVIDREYQIMKREIEAIAHKTEYSGKKLLTNSGNKFDIQVGINNGNTDQVLVDVAKIDATLKGLGLDKSTVISKEGSQMAITNLSGVIQRISGLRSKLGSTTNRLGKAAGNSTITRENLSDGNSRIKDTDYAEETARKAKIEILQGSATEMLNQANNNNNGVMKLLF